MFVSKKISLSLSVFLACNLAVEVNGVTMDHQELGDPINVAVISPENVTKEARIQILMEVEDLNRERAEASPYVFDTFPQSGAQTRTYQNNQYKLRYTQTIFGSVNADMILGKDAVIIVLRKDDTSVQHVSAKDAGMLLKIKKSADARKLNKFKIPNGEFGEVLKYLPRLQELPDGLNEVQDQILSKFPEDKPIVVTVVGDSKFPDGYAKDIKDFLDPKGGKRNLFVKLHEKHQNKSAISGFQIIQFGNKLRSSKEHRNSVPDAVLDSVQVQREAGEGWRLGCNLVKAISDCVKPAAPYVIAAGLIICCTGSSLS